MNKQVDILLATYQGAPYLEEQLDSIFNQTYTNFHLWIRDDDSSDQTPAILQKWVQNYPEKITLIPTTQRLGIKGNFSELMQWSRSPYIVFADQDDQWHPTKIEESLALMVKNEAIYGQETPLLVHTDLIVADQNLEILSHSFWNYSRINPSTANSLNRLLTHNVITGCTMLINKSLLQLAMPIPQKAMMHDWWIGLVASAFGHIDFLSKPTLFYRQHGKNDTGAKNWRSPTTYLLYAKKSLQLLGRKELRHRLLKTIDQSREFLNRYEKQLENNKEKRDIVTNYLSLGEASPIKKRYLFFRHRYFKNTFIKNVGVILFL